LVFSKENWLQPSYVWDLRASQEGRDMILERG
jgi:hypothetical protein